MENPRIHADINAIIGSYLRDLAFAQPSQQKMFGYKRAAAAILALETAVTDLVAPDAEIALAHARLAGIPADRIVNCWPLERLLAWASEPLCECRLS